MNSNRFCKFQTPARQKGSVLILVMVAVATAAVILMRTQFSSRQRMVKADSSLLAFQMEQAMTDTMLASCRNLANDEDLLVDTLEEPWAEASEIVNPAGISIRTRFEDANRYFDINNMLQDLETSDTREVTDIVNDLFNLCGDFSPGQRIQALSDWMDSNRNGFFESDLYEKGELPYAAKNRQFTDWSEWLSVRGFDLPYFGEAYTLRPRLPKDYEHIPLDTFTVLPVSRRIPTPVNVNTAGRQVLIGILGVSQTTLVDSIINARKLRPFRDMNTVVALVAPVLSPTVLKYMDVKSNYFILQAQAYHKGHTARAHALVFRDGGGDVEVLQWVM